MEKKKQQQLNQMSKSYNWMEIGGMGTKWMSCNDLKMM